MAHYATKEDLKNLGTKNDLQAVEARIVGSIKDLNTNFVKSQGFQNERMDQEFGQVNVKLEALLEESVVRKELRNLVGELHDKGVAVDSKKVFLAKT